MRISPTSPIARTPVRLSLTGAFVALGCSLVLALAPAGPLDRDLEEVEKDLERRPDDPALLIEAADAAFAEDDDDAALWYAELARMATEEGKATKAIDKTIQGLRGDIGVDLPPLGTAVDEYAKSIFQFAKLCSAAKLYANSADTLGSLVGTPYEDEALSRLDKLFKSKKAIGAMLEAGVPVKVNTGSRRGAKEIARIDKKHSDWENAYEAKGKYYTIRTNMGVVWAETFLGAMEQMNLFYRKTFDYKASGGSMRRCDVQIWKTREEFIAFNPDTGENVAGFYSPSDNAVSTYDPRTAEWPMQQPIEDLWSTLYHEASHQFTHMVWKTLIPTWLNEGTASYFEGAALLPGGFVETNRIPESRLGGVVHYIGGGDPANPRAVDALEAPIGAPKLWDVVTYFAPGSYEGEYYPFGWAMVYFCMNYENDESERVYTPVYRSFMRSYTDSGEERNVGKRFKQYFVTDAKLPGVDSYEDLEKRWKTWILDLSRIEFGGPEQCDVLIARARKQLENGKKAYAVDSLRWALRKRVDDPGALRLLGDTLASMKPKGKESKKKYKDGALFAYRKLVTVARAQRDPSQPLKNYDGTAAEALEAGIAGIDDINPSLSQMLAKQYDDFIDGAVAEADAWVEAEYPRVGLQVLAMANVVAGGEGRLLKRADEVREETGVDVRRTRRMPITPKLEEWETSGGGWVAILDEDGTTGLHRTSDKTGDATLMLDPPATFLYEVDIVLEATEGIPILGLTFAGGPTGDKTFVRLGKTGRAGLLQYDEEAEGYAFAPQFKGAGKMKKGEVFTLGIEVGMTETRFLIDGESIGEIEAAAATFAGQLGMWTQGVEARFMNPRLRY